MVVPPILKNEQPAIAPMNSAISDLTPFTGAFGFAEAAHLLRRTTFGYTRNQVQEAVENGLQSTLDSLFALGSEPMPPINFDDDEDTQVPIGETWINATYTPDRNQQEANARSRSLYAWQMKILYDEGVSIREKMVLFWQNHFVTADINDPKYLYHKISTIRANALGNFKTLTRQMTIDPAMLRYLNGNKNRKQAPNENYARELLELFTIGKGEPVGPGDYGTYTELDVKEIARALTGWRDYGYRNETNADFGAIYDANRHDQTPKQLSHRFGNALITDGGEDEYKQVIDIISSQQEVARFICRQLYIWFVNHEIDSGIEQQVIQPMAQILFAHDYEVTPALRALLSSEHFFDLYNRGCIIRNPLDFNFGILKSMEVPLPADLLSQYAALHRIHRYAASQDLRYFQPPSVAGWKAYYQEPVYYRFWINAVTLPVRMRMSDVLSFSGFVAGGERVAIDVLAVIDSLSNPLDPNVLISDLVELIFPLPITETQKSFLKSTLLPGLPDFEWTIEYNAYLQNPTNPQRRASVEQKLRSLFSSLFKMPEYYLS